MVFLVTLAVLHAVSVSAISNPEAIGVLIGPGIHAKVLVDCSVRPDEFAVASILIACDASVVDFGQSEPIRLRTCN